MILLEATILDFIGNLGPLVAAIAVIIAIITLRANHDWNRRNFASQMISNWNKQTKPVIDEIEKLEPRIIDFRRNRLTQITQEDAEKIYFSKYSEESREWKLRTRFIHLLNEFEHIAAAYKNAVGDRKMIEESFKDIYVKWGFVLDHFITTYKAERKNEYPWGPFHNLYDKWSTEKIDGARSKIDELRGPTG